MSVNQASGDGFRRLGTMIWDGCLTGVAATCRRRVEGAGTGTKYDGPMSSLLSHLVFRGLLDRILRILPCTSRTGGT